MATVTPPRSMKKEWLFRLVLLGISLVFSLGMAEIMVRIFFPVSDGLANVKLDGSPITGWFEPGTVYRQVSGEYDAMTTITGTGHRVPGSEQPEVIFVGDSFTYGFGLNDEETFASLYCTEMKRACANLGMPGSGTLRQLERLESFLTKYGWKPKEVKWFFFGMSTAWSAGNDFVDNYDRYTRDHSPQGAADSASAAEGVEASPALAQAAAPDVGLAERLIGMQAVLLEHSMLLRRVKYHWGPLIKSWIVADPGEYRMKVALTATREAFAKLDALSKRQGFEYTIYLLPAVHDILRGTQQQTVDTLNSVTPKPVVPVIDVFLDSPKSYSYGLDGHLNPKGARKVAELLVSRDRKNTP